MDLRQPLKLPLTERLKLTSRPRTGGGVWPLPQGMLLGGYSPDITAYDAMVAPPSDWQIFFASYSTWSGMVSSVTTFGSGVVANGKKPQVCAIPLCMTGGNLADTAAGTYNSYFVQAAQALIALYPNAQDAIFIRLGWEWNGGWQPWKAQDATAMAVYAEAFRQAVNAFRSVSQRFKFVMCTNTPVFVTSAYPDLSPALPGAAYVDIYSVDVYYNANDAGDGKNPVGVFNAWKRADRWGLDYWRDLAVSQGKKFAIDEFGLWNEVAEEPSEASNIAFLDLLLGYLRDNDALYFDYWDSNSGKTCRLSDNSQPLTAARLKQWIGPPVFTSVNNPTVSQGSALSFTLTTSSQMPVDFTITGGADAAQFSIAGNTLSAPNTLALGSYAVQVTAKQNKGRKLSSTQNITLAVEAPWTPASGFESGVTIARWYDAQDAATITQSGGLVSQWNDKSANAKHLTQATGGNKPTYSATGRNSKPTIFFGANKYLNSTDVTNLPAGQAATTIACACYGTASMASFAYFISETGTGDAPNLGSGSGGLPRYNASGNISAASGPSIINNDVNFIFACDAGSSVSAEMSANGNTPSTTSSLARGAFTPASLIFGATAADRQVHIKEVLILTGRVTVADRARLADYFARRW
jgi:hypothetical protein